MHLFLLFLSCALLPAFGAVGPASIETKKVHPPHPEEGGLRLEIAAQLNDVLIYGEQEGVTMWRWGGAYLNVDVAVRNISTNVVTVPTSSFDRKIALATWPAWGEQMERITIFIEPPRFLGKPAAFAATRFAPVPLDPGECALLLNHHVFIADRKHVDAIREASVHFGVSAKFNGINHWWHGHLEAYHGIERRIDVDAELAQRNTPLSPKLDEPEKRKP
jgi:hypothetical protein